MMANALTEVNGPAGRGFRDMDAVDPDEGAP
jgi:hypothetical protein